MKHTLLAGAALAGSLLFAPSAFAFTAQSMCPQWVQRGPHITAVCFSGHGNGLVPAAIDLRAWRRRRQLFRRSRVHESDLARLWAAAATVRRLAQR